MNKRVFGILALISASSFVYGQSEQAAFKSLCEEFGDCPSAQVQIVIKKEVVIVPVEIIKKETVIIKEKVYVTQEPEVIKAAPPAIVKKIEKEDFVFDNKIVNIQLLGMRVSKDKKTIIVQFNFTNQLEKTLWIYTGDFKEFVVTDTNAKVWKLSKVIGLAARHWEKSQFTPKSESKCQFVFQLSEDKELTDDSEAEVALPFFVNGKIFFSTKEEKGQFAFGFQDVNPNAIL